MTRTALLASLAAFVLVQGVSVIGQGNKTPMTPWGEPDLQGTWTSEAELSVPFERPREYGNRQVLTDAEFTQRQRNRSDSSRATTPTSISRPPIGRTPARWARPRRRRRTGSSAARPHAGRRW